jgi:Phytanoyl-CoA dioxygenase (PhyH)
MQALFKSLEFKRPLPVQSMYICKQPKIGGEVVPHQDSTFLWCETVPLRREMKGRLADVLALYPQAMSCAGRIRPQPQASGLRWKTPPRRMVGIAAGSR